MAITPRDGLNQYKFVVFILEIDLASLHFFWSSSQISDDETSTEACREGENAQDPSEKIMTPWMFDIEFLYGTQFTFGSFTFTVGKDVNLKMLPLGQAPGCLALVYGQAPYFLVISSTTGGACSSLNPYVGLHIRTVKLVRGIPIMTSILQPSAGASSSPSSATSPD
jgi:hypothetical protein